MKIGTAKSELIRSDSQLSIHAQLLEAETLRRSGHLHKAKLVCEELLRRHPEYVGALQTLGAAHLESNNFQAAFKCFSEVARLCPNDPVNLDNLAKACLGLGAYEMAGRCLNEARRLQPADRELLWSLANLHREQRDYDRAAEAFRAILAQAPDAAKAAHGLGDCLVHTGQIDEARAVLIEANRLQPHSISILYSLAQVPGTAQDFDLLAALVNIRRLKSQGADDVAAMTALTRAVALDQRRQYPEAWSSLMEASRIAAPGHAEAFRKHQPFMAAALSAAQNFEPLHGRSPLAAGPLALFILGPSRSGKTSLERLVASIAGVHRGHESRFVERATRRTSQLSGLLTTHNPAELPAALSDRLRKAFDEELSAVASGSAIITDTYPAMIAYVGRVAAVLPNARFAFVTRDPYDAALRILMRQYRSGNHYAYAVDSVFGHLNWYEAMAQVWHEKLADRSVRISYDDMVADPSGAVTKIARLCGVDVPVGVQVNPGDDRRCGAPYRSMMDGARTFS